MTVFVQLLLTALMAVTAENILFAGGIGFSRVLRAARRPRTLGMYSGFVTVFSLISTLLSSLLGPALLANAALTYLRPVIFALCAAAAYLAASFLLQFFLPSFFRKYGEILSPAAINTIVLSMPFVQKSFKLDIANAAAFAVGTGVAFFLAARILARTMARYKNDDMPRAFNGLPAVLIYIGILSLAFAGFTGGKIF